MIALTRMKRNNFVFFQKDYLFPNEIRKTENQHFTLHLHIPPLKRPKTLVFKGFLFDTYKNPCYDESDFERIL